MISFYLRILVRVLQVLFLYLYMKQLSGNHPENAYMFEKFIMCLCFSAVHYFPTFHQIAAGMKFLTLENILHNG